jgi:uncharacterized membrane protein YraQ (UPF0718 family)
LRPSRAFAFQLFGPFRDTLPYMAVGIAVDALIHGAVPTEFLQRIAGPGSPLTSS